MVAPHLWRGRQRSSKRSWAAGPAVLTTLALPVPCLWVSAGSPWPRGGEFSLASWNILSPRFETDNYHPYVSKEHRAWEYRKPLLVKRMLDLEVDVLCCQEAANEEMSLVPDMENAGYMALVPPERKDDLEGIEKPITFVRRKKFQVLASDYRSRANLHALRDDEASRTLLLANVHLQGNPLAIETRRSQLRSALRRLRRLGESGDGDAAAVGVVVAGDFNDLAGSRLHMDLQQGLLDSEVQKPWTFRDAMERGQFLCTFRGAGRCDRIDFIYHSHGLATSALRNALTAEEEEKLSWSLSKPWPPWPEFVPGAWYPSDHVPVAVQFSWPGKSG